MRPSITRFWRDARLALSAGVAAGLAALAAPAALACSMLPPPIPPMLAPLPDEPAGDFEKRRKLHLDGFAALQNQRALETKRERQSAAWREAAQVAVVEIVSVQKGVKVENFPGFGAVRVTVKPVAWIKGANGPARKAAFALTQTAFTSCGPMPMWSIFGGQAGDRFLAFLKAGAINQEAVLEVLPPNELVVGEVTKALAAQVRPAK